MCTCVHVCVHACACVHVSRAPQDWGSLPVLRRQSRSVLLRNESPIPAPFQAFLLSAQSHFDVRPCSGCVEPNGELSLEVDAFLEDSVVVVRLCCAVLCRAALCCAVLCCDVCAVPCCAVIRCAVL